MKKLQRFFLYGLSPLFLLLAILLFVLDKLNVDVNPVTAYIAKDNS